MDELAKVIGQRRDEYLHTFRWFIEQKRKELGGGGPEVKFEVPKTETLYRGLYCVDFVNNRNGHLDVVELQLDHQDRFERVSGQIGETTVSIESLNWGAADLRHDAAEVADDKVLRWFNYWFDPDDVRFDPTSEFSGVIHQLAVQPGLVAIDFGTASSDALWDMLELLRASGALHIRITSDDS